MKRNPEDWKRAINAAIRSQSKQITAEQMRRRIRRNFAALKFCHAQQNLRKIVVAHQSESTI